MRGAAAAAVALLLPLLAESRSLRNVRGVSDFGPTGQYRSVLAQARDRSAATVLAQSRIRPQAKPHARVQPQVRPEADGGSSPWKRSVGGNSENHVAFEGGNNVKPSKDLPQQFVQLLKEENNGSRVRKEPWYSRRLDLRGGTLPKIVGGSFPALENGTTPIKLVIWMPVLSSQVEVLEAHRSTWMNQPGVCAVEEHAKSDCHVFPVWVYGNVSAKQRSRALEIANGTALPVFSEDIPEPNAEDVYGYGGYEGSQMIRSKAMVKNMNAKTPFAYKYASKNFRWASHVVRMDLDAFPWLHTIMSDLDKLPRNSLVYGPRERLWIPNLAEGPHAGQQDNCTTGAISGYFSGLSLDLVDCWVKQEAMPPKPNENRRKGWDWPLEDVIFTDILFDAQRDGTCPRMWCANIKNARRVDHPVR